MLTTGERIKQLRKRKGLSQAELAEEIGVKSNTVSTWERGTRKPDFEALNLLSSYFEVSFEYILGTSDDDASRRIPSQEELNELAIEDLADELYDVVKRFAKLSPKSRRIVTSVINTCYKEDRDDGLLMAKELFDILVTPKKNSE